MILVPCPWCGPRNASEFVHRGQPSPRPDVATTTPEEWRSYLYMERNACGWVTERWLHRAGCRRHLVVERHTLTNEIREVSS